MLDSMIKGLLSSYVKPEKKNDAKSILEEVMEDGKINKDDIPAVMAKLNPMLKEGGTDAIKDILLKLLIKKQPQTKAKT